MQDRLGELRGPIWLGVRDEGEAMSFGQRGPGDHTPKFRYCSKTLVRAHEKFLSVITKA